MADTNEPPNGSKPAPVLDPGLYIVATPIGNLRDITYRAVDTLKAADQIACEDTRVTAKLLHAHDIRTAMTAYHEHNAAKVRPKLIRQLQEGGRIALVSDAGTPLISDPGYRLVTEAVAAGIPVTAIPGASATLTALASAGLPTDRFLFAGFLPPRSGQRQTALRPLAAIVATLVFFESPRRFAAVLRDMRTVLGPRQAAIARELTKRYEEIRRGSLDDLIQHYDSSEPPPGEAVIVVGPPEADAADDAPDLDAMLRRAMQDMSLRDAAASVAEATGSPRREVYARALALDR
jgi:16S rRNA (cytidine1402-2'-O)-methyltransferase